jgi:hypothetical protein
MFFDRIYQIGMKNHGCTSVFAKGYAGTGGCTQMWFWKTMGVWFYEPLLNTDRH